MRAMISSEAIGYAAATLTTASFLPQAWYTFRTRDVRGISLGMYLIFVTGVSLWLAYGVLTAAWPIVIANAITLALASVILGMKLRFQKLPHPLQPGD
jgi:MtN3 and saliva related transmembrane protein